MIRVLGFVSGRVQGVCFRRFAQQAAQQEAVSGYARNLADGRVEILLEGDPGAVARVRQKVEKGPPAASVDRVDWQKIPVSDPEYAGFAVF